MYDFLFLGIYKKEFGEIFNNIEYLGLYYLASYLNNYNYSAKVYTNEKYESFETIKNECKKAKIIGFYCDYDNQFEVKYLSNYLKTNYPDLIILIGGPQGIALNENFIIEAKADVIAVGEGETTIKELADYYLKNKGDLNDVSGIKFIKNNHLFETPKRKTIENLDEIPFPDKKYSLNNQFRNQDKVTILTGRGCPFQCTFCFEAKDKLRVRSLKNVFEEIDLIIESNPNLKLLVITDDTFTLNKERIFDFCNKIDERRKIKDFVWSCEAHISNLLKNPEIISKMLKSGLVRMQIGIESGDDSVLKLYNKKITTTEIKEFIKICKLLNVPQLATNFIIGGANESYQSLLNSINLAEELIETGKGMIDIFTSFFFPYSNTQITINPDKFNMNILDSNSYTSMSDYVVVETKNLTKQQIFEMKQRIDSSIYYKTEKIILNLTFGEIKLQYFTAIKYGLKSVWYYYLSKYDFIHNYFNHIINKTGFIFEEIKNNISLFKPLRTFSIENIYIEDECFVYNKKQFTKIETILLEYSTAKLNIKEISTLLNINIDEIINIYNNLSKEYFIIFVEW